MNPLPIEQAQDADLRASLPALQRAARRAREMAQATGTTLVVSRNGVIEHLDPTSMEAVRAVPSPASPVPGRR